MNETKFRVWACGIGQDAKNPKMIYFNLATVPKGNIYCDDMELDSKFIMQYTGLKDKNGVEEYYVDDLFDYGSGRIGRVVFYERSYCGSIWNPLKREWTTPNFWIDPSNYPKIGNIYTNPELLNK